VADSAPLRSSHRLRRSGRRQGEPAAPDSRYSLRCLVERINGTPEGRRNIIVYGALKDALRDGKLDAFEADLVGAVGTKFLLDILRRQSSRPSGEGWKHRKPFWRIHLAILYRSCV
jgi:hypothetical protein